MKVDNLLTVEQAITDIHAAIKKIDLMDNFGELYGHGAAGRHKLLAAIDSFMAFKKQIMADAETPYSITT